MRYEPCPIYGEDEAIVGYGVFDTEPDLYALAGAAYHWYCDEPTTLEAATALAAVANHASAERYGYTRPVVIVCADCCSGISNDDWSWLDGRYLEAEAAEVFVRIRTYLTRVGWLTYSGSDIDDDYSVWCLTCCIQIQPGQPHHVFETETGAS